MLTLPETPAVILYGYPGYLFAGTYRHLYRSTTDGMSWTSLGLNLISDDQRVNDILVQDDRLWVATQKGLFTKKITDTAWVLHRPDSVFRFLAKSGSVFCCDPVSFGTILGSIHQEIINSISIVPTTFRLK